MDNQKPAFTVKTSHKQKIFYFLELITIVCGIVAMVIFSDNPSLWILSLVIAFILAITFLIIAIKDGVTRYQAAYQEYQTKLLNKDGIKKITDYKNKVNSFDYAKASKEEKGDYLVFSLYNAVLFRNCGYFYLKTSDFCAEEIQELFGFLQITKDLRDFIGEVIVKRKLTKAIYRFEPELWDLILVNAKYKEERDSLYFDEKVYYDPTKHIRYYVRFRKDANDYQICHERFDISRKDWQTKIAPTSYDSLCLANVDCEREFKKGIKGNNYEDFLTIHDYSQDNENWDDLWALYEENKLIDKNMFYFLDYYNAIIKEGHDWFLSNKDYSLYQEALKNNLSQELIRFIEEAIRSDTLYRRIDICSVCDVYFRDHVKELNDIIQSYANIRHNLNN